MLSPWILCWVRQTLRLVVCYILDAKIFEYFKECFANMVECHSSVVRVALLHEHVTVEASHLWNSEDADAAE